MAELLENHERFDWLFANCTEVRELVRTIIICMDDTSYRIELCKLHSTCNPPSYTSSFQVEKIVRGWKGTEPPTRAWVNCDLPTSEASEPDAAFALAVGLLRERKK